MINLHSRRLGPAECLNSLCHISACNISSIRHYFTLRRRESRPSDAKSVMVAKLGECRIWARADDWCVHTLEICMHTNVPQRSMRSARPFSISVDPCLYTLWSTMAEAHMAVTGHQALKPVRLARRQSCTSDEVCARAQPRPVLTYVSQYIEVTQKMLQVRPKKSPIPF